METGRRTRGAPRRGPFSGKKITASTKVTEETMERLAIAAKASEMSVSQKFEAVVIRGLGVEDAYERHFAPIIRAFEQHMTLSMPGEDDDAYAWAKIAKLRVAHLAHDLEREIEVTCAPLLAQAEPGAAPLPQARPASPIGPKKRDLDLT